MRKLLFGILASAFVIVFSSCAHMMTEYEHSPNIQYQKLGEAPDICKDQIVLFEFKDKLKIGKVLYVFENGRVRIEKWDFSTRYEYTLNIEDLSPEVNCINGICRDDRVILTMTRDKECKRIKNIIGKVTHVFTNKVARVKSENYIHFRNIKNISKEKRKSQNK